MAGFQRGDRVIVDGNLIAEIVSYDEGANLVVYKHQVGSGTNTATAHISKTRLDAFPGGTVELNDSVLHVEESTGEDEPEAAASGLDEFTSLD